MNHVGMKFRERVLFSPYILLSCLMISQCCQRKYNKKKGPDLKNVRQAGSGNEKKKLQGILTLIACCIAHSRIPDVQDEISHVINNMNLVFTKEYLEVVRDDPGKFITFGICFACFHIFLCLMYIYGAYACNNMFMFGFILTELARLVALSLLVATWLLVLKQNTMDIGLLIGASVGSGFFLLGMFYLWVCAANLPVLINEMERDEQAEMIARLQRLLQENPKHVSRSLAAFPENTSPYRDVFMVPRKMNDFDKQGLRGSRAPLPYYR